jgi:hypothetical protein
MTTGPVTTGPGTVRVDVPRLPVVGGDVTAGVGVSVGAGSHPVDISSGVGIVLPPVVVPGLDVAVTTHVQVKPTAVADDVNPIVTSTVQDAVSTADDLLGGTGSAQPSA